MTLEIVMRKPPRQINRPQNRAPALAQSGCNPHLPCIEFRPNDLASPLTARLTDDLLPKNLERTGRVTTRLEYARTKGRAPMNKGTVKWFNNQKGFGFIQPESGNQDVFVHISAVERAGLSTLNEGQQVTFDIVADSRSGKSAAENLRAA